MAGPHTLHPTGRRPLPQSVVVVHAKVQQKYLSESDDVGHMALSSWYAQVGIVVGNTIDWRAESHGERTATWWRWLQEHTAGHAAVHIYSWQAREQLAALGLWDQLADGKYTLDGLDPYGVRNSGKECKDKCRCYVVLEGPPTIVQFKTRHAGIKYTWLDPRNYGVRDLRHWSECGPNEQTERDKLTGEVWFSQAEPQVVTYAVCNLITDYYAAICGLDLGGPEHTAASQAMQAFRYHYMRHRIECHGSDAITKLERAALYGGRCECRYIGELHAGDRPGELYSEDRPMSAARWNTGLIYHLDVNSMYPGLAAAVCLPTRLTAHVGATDTDTLIAACRACGVIADVIVDTPVPCVPVRSNGHILYPTGRFATTLCGPELTLAHTLGAKLQCRRLALYEVAPIYHNMVERLWSARLQYAEHGKLGMKSLIKAILNSAFGKWAQRRKRWADCPDVMPMSPYMQWWESNGDGGSAQYRSLAWHVQRQEDCEDESPDVFPAITAYVNSYGRTYLWGLIDTAGWDNVYYYDTDSIFTNETGLQRLRELACLSDTSLGKLKVVGSHGSVRILGRQCYECDGKLTLSGAHGDARCIGDAYAEVLKAPPVGYYLAKRQPPGLDRHIARVSVSRPYPFGHVQPDGRVAPPHFGPLKSS